MCGIRCRWVVSWLRSCHSLAGARSAPNEGREVSSIPKLYHGLPVPVYLKPGCFPVTLLRIQCNEVVQELLILPRSNLDPLQGDTLSLVTQFPIHCRHAKTCLTFAMPYVRYQPVS
eukprot:sb/3476607/